MSSSSGMTTKQLEPIAERINGHLHRFEEDPEINAPVTRPNGMTVTPYYHAQACAWRKRVRVRYVMYQGESDLTGDEALAYLEWLDAGNVGTHHQMRHGAVASPDPRTENNGAMTSALTARQQQALELLGRFGKVSRRTAAREGFRFETFQALVKHGLAAERPVSRSAGTTITVIVSLDGGR